MLLSKVEIVAKLKKKILTLIAITVVLQDHHCFTTRTVIRHAMEVNYHYIAIVVKMVHFFDVQMVNCAMMEMLKEVLENLISSPTLYIWIKRNHDKQSLIIIHYLPFRDERTETSRECKEEMEKYISKCSKLRQEVMEQLRQFG